MPEGPVQRPALLISGASAKIKLQPRVTSSFSSLSAFIELNACIADPSNNDPASLVIYFYAAVLGCLDY